MISYLKIINRFYNLHLTLIRIIYINIKKQKTKKEVIYFLKQLFKSYLRELLRLFNDCLLFLDPLYLKQIKEYNKYQKAKKEISGLIKLLRHSKERLKHQGISRQRIKRFFIDLGSSDDDALQKLCDDLIKEFK